MKLLSSLIKIVNSRGPRMDPWGTLERTKERYQKSTQNTYKLWTPSKVSA
jgi:hypothetical protein